MSLPPLNKKFVIYIAFFSSLISAIFTIYLYINFPKKNAETILQKAESFKTTNENKNFAILLLGYGGSGHAGGGLSDANIIINVNNDKKLVSFIAIPRDLWVLIPLNGDAKNNYKINAAFAFGNDDEGYPNKDTKFTGKNGGGNLAKAVFSDISGININYYAAIDFERFEKAIDAIGGVNVDVPVAFKDEYFPIKGSENLLCDFTLQEVDELKIKYSGFELEKNFKCRYETLEFSKGIANMNGATALKFIRSRHSNTQGSDFSRGVRTQAVLSAIKNKLLSLDAIDNIDEFYDQFRKLVTTDLGKNNLAELISKLDINNLSDYDFQNINITTENFLNTTRSSDGQEILIPNAGINNFEDIKKFIINNI